MSLRCTWGTMQPNRGDEGADTDSASLSPGAQTPEGVQGADSEPPTAAFLRSLAGSLEVACAALVRGGSPDVRPQAEGCGEPAPVPQPEGFSRLVLDEPEKVSDVMDKLDSVWGAWDVHNRSPEATSVWRGVSTLRATARLFEVRRLRQEQQDTRNEMAELWLRMAELSAREQETGRRIEAAEVKLEVTVNAPVPLGDDPTLWLPDEVLVQVLAAAPIEALWEGRVASVCRRWRRLSRDSVVLERIKAAKWQAFADGVIRPLRVRLSPPSAAEGPVYRRLLSLAVGPDGTVFAGGINGVVHAWQPLGDRPSLSTFRAPDTIASVTAVAVCENGATVWTGDDAGVIRVWSSGDEHELLSVIDRVDGHTDAVWSFAENPDGTVFSASEDTDVRVWRPISIGGGGGGVGAFECVRVLAGHHWPVCDIVATQRGELFSADAGCRVMMWSCADGTQLRSFTINTDGPLFGKCLALSPDDGRLYVFAATGGPFPSSRSTLWSCLTVRDAPDAADQYGGWILADPDTDRDVAREGQLTLDCFDVGPTGEIVTAVSNGCRHQRFRGITVGKLGLAESFGIPPDPRPVVVKTAAARGHACATKIYRVKVGADGTVYTLHWDAVLRVW